MAKEKQKRTVADKGKKKLTTVEEEKENSCPMDQVFRKRNTGVVIHDEQDNRRLREDEGKAEAKATEKQKGTAVDKGKKKITTAGKKKENSCPMSSQPWLVDAFEKLILNRPNNNTVLAQSSKSWREDAWEKLTLQIMHKPNDKNTILILIIVLIFAIYMFVPILENDLGVVLQGSDQDSISFSTSDATDSTYSSFIGALRARLTNGVLEVYGIPMLPQRSSVPDSRRFVLVDLSNYDGNTVTVAIDVVNAYVVAFRVHDQAYFFRDAPKAAFTTLFTEITETVNRQTLDCSGNYVDLERRSQSREQTKLGIDALDHAISKLWYNVDTAFRSSFRVIIQMVSEAVRYKHIERRIRQSITRGNSFQPDPRLLSLQNNWSSLSTEIQRSPDGVEFNRPVRLQNSDYSSVEVANSLSPVIAGLAMMLYSCPPSSQSDNTNLALRLARTAFSDYDGCDNGWNLTETLEMIFCSLIVLLLKGVFK